MEWLRGSLIQKEKEIYLEKYHTTGSGVISSLSQTNGIIEIDDYVEKINKGNLLKFFKYEDLLG